MWSNIDIKREANLSKPYVHTHLPKKKMHSTDHKGKSNDSFKESVITEKLWIKKLKDPNQDSLAFIISQAVSFVTLLSDLFYCFHRRRRSL